MLGCPLRAAVCCGTLNDPVMVRSRTCRKVGTQNRHNRISHRVHACTLHEAGSTSWSRVGGVVLSAFLLVSPSPALAGEVYEGPARIVDGDTLYVQEQKFRLFGIDAPEKGQSCSTRKGAEYACGKLSLTSLQEHVGKKPVRCKTKEKDQYGRYVGVCYLVDGRQTEDLNGWLVSNGLAVAYRSFSQDYVVAEEKAHAQQKGIWQGKFTMPAAWRYQQRMEEDGTTSSPSRAPAAPPVKAAPSSLAAGSYAAALAAGSGTSSSAAGAGATVSGLCKGHPAIKGNINAKGQKIYHVPGSSTYDRVKIEEAAGEKYFCSASEAEAAGWRASQWRGP